MCLVFARTAPTRRPLVARLAAEVVTFKQSEDHHPGLHRFFQGATWFWAGLFLLLTLGMAVMMKTEPFKLFMLLSTVVTIGLTALGAACARSGSSPCCAAWASGCASPPPDGGFPLASGRKSDVCVVAQTALLRRDDRARLRRRRRKFHGVRAAGGRR